jgi:peptide-methionine (R)-S-oxide reductase
MALLAYWRARRYSRPYYLMECCSKMAHDQFFGEDLIPAIQNNLGMMFMGDKVEKTDEEWRQLLTPEQFAVARKKGTERAFTGKYWNFHEDGLYLCICCGNELFASDTKYESGCGWPSFYAPLNDENVATAADNSFGMQRTEVTCSRCGAHLGHVFEDGPRPTGLRFCMNSASLKFMKKEP